MGNKKIIIILSIIILSLIGFFLVNNISHNQMGGMSMNMGNTNINSEKDFIYAMIPHHQEAIDTSKIILEKSNNQALLSLAQNIVSAQENEIHIMNDILTQKYPNSGENMMYHNMMKDLTNLNEKELEKTYLEGMIEHHKGAIEMANSAQHLELSPEIKNIVNNIISSQESEIEMMKQILK